MGDQPNWACCQKCDTLVFAGGEAGACAAGESHELRGSGNFVVPMEARANSQTKWRRCVNCEALTYAGGLAEDACPAGGAHVAGEGGYRPEALMLNAPPLGSTGQPGWRWCQKCDGMTFSDGVMPGDCPAGGGHDDSVSGHYWMFFTADPLPSGLKTGPSRFVCDAAA
jgi:hypothetical protein